jgi:hypothetical protein
MIRKYSIDKKHIYSEGSAIKSDAILSKIKFMEREDLLRVVNGSYIADRFFGKSGCWFSQKLNGNMKNGKRCEFTADERKTLSNALYTIAIELQDLADELR